MIENDCEDQSFRPISDGCLMCSAHPALVKRRQNGGVFWICPTCNGSYGPADLRYEYAEVIGIPTIIDRDGGKMFPCGYDYLDRSGGGRHTHRRKYTRAEARAVADWLNGMDQPLPKITDRAIDPWDPVYRQKSEGFHDEMIVTQRALASSPCKT